MTTTAKRRPLEPGDTVRVHLPQSFRHGQTGTVKSLPVSERNPEPAFAWVRFEAGAGSPPHQCHETFVSVADLTLTK